MSFVMTYTNLLTTIQDQAENTNTDFVDALPMLVLFGQKRIARELKILGLQKFATSTFTAASGIVQKPSRWLKTISMNYGTSSGEATGATVTAGGSSYKMPLTITSSGGGATTQATWDGFVVNGVVTQIVPLTPGVGYTSAPTLTISGFGSSGTGATATATVSTANIKRTLLLPRSYEFCRAYWPNENTTGTPRFYADYDWNNWLVVPTPATAFPVQADYYELAAPLDASNTTNWLTENAPDLLLYACLLECAKYVQNQEQEERWQKAYTSAGAAYGAEDTSRKSDATEKVKA